MWQFGDGGALSWALSPLREMRQLQVCKENDTPFCPSAPRGCAAKEVTAPPCTVLVGEASSERPSLLAIPQAQMARLLLSCRRPLQAVLVRGRRLPPNSAIF
jgi:hypothetical protein